MIEKEDYFERTVTKSNVSQSHGNNDLSIQTGQPVKKTCENPQYCQ